MTFFSFLTHITKEVVFSRTVLIWIPNGKLRLKSARQHHKVFFFCRYEENSQLRLQFCSVVFIFPINNLVSLLSLLRSTFVKRHKAVENFRDPPAIHKVQKEYVTLPRRQVILHARKCRRVARGKVYDISTSLQCPLWRQAFGFSVASSPFDCLLSAHE